MQQPGKPVSGSAPACPKSARTERPSTPPDRQQTGPPVTPERSTTQAPEGRDPPGPGPEKQRQETTKNQTGRAWSKAFTIRPRFGATAPHPDTRPRPPKCRYEPDRKQKPGPRQWRWPNGRTRQRGGRVGRKAPDRTGQRQRQEVHQNHRPLASTPNASAAPRPRVANHPPPASIRNSARMPSSVAGRQHRVEHCQRTNSPKIPVVARISAAVAPNSGRSGNSRCPGATSQRDRQDSEGRSHQSRRNLTDPGHRPDQLISQKRSGGLWHRSRRSDAER